MATKTPVWDEPGGANSPRGWLRGPDGTSIGFYLDYGPDHYRNSHETEIWPGQSTSFCTPDDQCRECQPGNILARRYPNGDNADGDVSRYVETVEEARRYVETGSTESTQEGN